MIAEATFGINDNIPVKDYQGFREAIPPMSVKTTGP